MQDSLAPLNGHINIVLDDEYLLVMKHKSCSEDKFYTLVWDKRSNEVRDDCIGYRNHRHCKHVDAFCVLAGLKDGKVTMR